MNLRIYPTLRSEVSDLKENYAIIHSASPNLSLKNFNINVLSSPFNESSLLLNKKRNLNQQRALWDISNNSPTLKDSKKATRRENKNKDKLESGIIEGDIEYEYMFIGDNDPEKPDFFGFFRDPLNLNRLYINYYVELPDNKDYWKSWITEVNLKKYPYDESFCERIYNFGISHELRHIVWEILLDSQKYQVYRPSYHELKEKGKHLIHGKQISLDLNRTYSTHQLFNSGTSYGQVSLCNILNAYAHYNERVGYCQGMAFLAGMFLMITDEEQSFWMFAALLDLCDIENYYEPSMSGFIKDTEIFGQMLKYEDRELYDHFEKYNIELSFITSKWFLQLFSDLNDWRTVLRIWDIILFEKKDCIFKIALGILNVLKDDILSFNSPEYLYTYLLNINAEKIHYSRLFPAIYDIDIAKIRRNIQKFENPSNSQLISPKKSVVKELWDKLKRTTKKQTLKPNVQNSTLSTPVSLHNKRKRLSPYAKNSLFTPKIVQNETQWEGIDELLMDSTEKKEYKDSVFKLKHKNIDHVSLSPILINLD